MAKLKLDRPRLRILDIGSGWGGLALDLARHGENEVFGITVCANQLAIAAERAASARLAERCRFALQDYRDIQGEFDRVVSVGMFEHVGVPHYDSYFRKIAQVLTEDGVALVHTIGRSDPPGTTSHWVTKHIFPGGYMPAMSEVVESIERSGLYITDVEVWRLHYADTLREWRARFLRNRDHLLESHDQRFCRMWEFYLASAEMAFRYDRQVVFQFQLTKRVDVLPPTRNYMQEVEDEMRARALHGNRCETSLDC